MDKAEAVEKLCELLEVMQRAPTMRAGIPGERWQSPRQAAVVRAVVIRDADIEALAVVLLPLLTASSEVEP